MAAAAVAPRRALELASLRFCMLDMRSYRVRVAWERSLAISRRLRALRPRALASLVFREVDRAFTSAEAAALFSPTRRVSTFFTSEVTVAIWVAKSLRSCCTWRVAWERAAERSLTVLEKRESARAACLARASLRPVEAAPSFLSKRPRLAASLSYALPNFWADSFSAMLSWVAASLRAACWRAASLEVNLARAWEARACSAFTLAVVAVARALISARAFLAWLRMRIA